MGVTKYQSNGRTLWRIDEWLSVPDGPPLRMRKSRIPTREQAMALAAKLKVEAFEGSFFGRHRHSALTVRQAWAAYEPAARRDNRAWQTDSGRAKHLVRWLGDKTCTALTLRHVDEYRDHRLLESTQRGAPPSAATLDREVELLKRLLSYASSTGLLTGNPLAEVKLLRKPNVRRRVVEEVEFERLFEASEATLKPLLLVAFDTGMRLREILDLQWSQVDLRTGVIRLLPQDTKAEDARTVLLTARVLRALKALPRGASGVAVFPNPSTGAPWQDIRQAFRRAVVASKLEGLWFHDLRRSFVTRARKLGISESVVMRMSGHRTRAVFDRYNIVDERDLREAVRVLEKVGRVLDTVTVSGLHKRQSPTA